MSGLHESLGLDPRLDPPDSAEHDRIRELIDSVEEALEVYGSEVRRFLAGIEDCKDVSWVAYIVEARILGHNHVGHRLTEKARNLAR